MLKYNTRNSNVLKFKQNLNNENLSNLSYS